MGLFDNIVDAGEDLVHSGEKVLGKAVDGATDLVGDGLRDVGLDGAANAVEDFGDYVADQLGATPDEKSLDETDDPKELVHGDPGALHDRASSLTSMSGSLEQGGSGLRGISVGNWSGDGAEAYHQKTATEFPKWFTAADACDAASGALTALAGAVEAAQKQAAEAVRLWKEAQRQHDAWAADVTTRTNSYNTAARAYNARVTDVRPTAPIFGPDPGPALKQQANDVLKRARDQRNAAADDAAGALRGAAGQAPPMPAAGERLTDSLGDLYTAGNIASGHFSAGALGVVTDTVKMVRTLSPQDPYNVSHPAEYARNSTALAAGLVKVASDPKELGKAFIGTGWSKDPAQAMGALTANVASLAAPGPKGAGALSGAARAASGAGREATSMAGNAAREGATAGVRDAASAAGHGLSDARPTAPHIGETPLGQGHVATASHETPRTETPVSEVHDGPPPSQAGHPGQPEPQRVDATPHDSGPPGRDPSGSPDGPATTDHGPSDRTPPTDTTPPARDGSPHHDPSDPPGAHDAPESKSPVGDPSPTPHHDVPPERETPNPVRDDGPDPEPHDSSRAPEDGGAPPHGPDGPGGPHDRPSHTEPHDPRAPGDVTKPDAPDRTPTPDRDVDTAPARDTPTPQPSHAPEPPRTPVSPTEAPPLAAATPHTGTPVGPPHTAPANSSPAADARAPETRGPVQASRADAAPSNPASAPRAADSGLPEYSSGARPDAVSSTPGSGAAGRVADAAVSATPRMDQPAAGIVGKAPEPVVAAPTRAADTGGAIPRDATTGGTPHGAGGGEHPVYEPTDPHVPDDPIDHERPHASTDRELCTARGEPVDVATGEYFLPAIDVDLPGILPLLLVRTHRSQFRGGQWFGPSWSSTLDARAVADDDGVTTVDPDGVVLRFPPVTEGETAVPERGSLWRLARTPVGGYVLTDRTGDRHYWFDPKPQLGGADIDAGAFTVSAITDRNRNRILFGYSDKGVPISVEHSGGYRISIDTVDGRVTRYRAITVDAMGVTSTTLREFGYTEGDLTWITDAAGATTSFGYDDHRMVRWTDSIGQTYENTYDDAGRVIYQTGTDGVWAGRFDYRDLPDGTGTVTAFTDAVGATTYYAIDVDGRPQRVIDPVGRETVTRWDLRRNPISSTDPSGATTSFDYDGRGDLVSVTGPTGGSTSMAYAAQGLPSRITHPDGTTETIRYDERGNAVSVTDAAGSTSSVERAPTGAPAAQLDTDGRRVTMDSNAAGLPTRVEDAIGYATQIEYDPLGRPVRVIAADGGITQRRYDPEGRLLAEVAPDGAEQRWTYDGEGNRLSHVDAVGSETRWYYGFYDLPVTRIDADGAITVFEYDSARRLIGVVNPLGQRWGYEYNPDGRVVREVDFSGAATMFGYDEVGRLAWKINGADQRIDYTYDVSGCLVGERSDEEMVTYERDPLGRMVAAQNSFGQTEFEYDAVGRLVSESWDGAAVRSVWSASGTLLSRYTPAGASTGYTYDIRGAVAGIDVDGRSIDLSVDALGRETRRGFGTVAIDSSWDASGRLARRSVVGGVKDPRRLDLGMGVQQTERLSASSAFAYRPDGALQAVTGEGPAREGLGKTARFDLDALGRVTSVSDVDGAARESFDYDSGNNIVAESVAGERRGWTYRDGRLADDGRCSYSYDGAGRVVQVVRRRLSRKPDVWEYGWDAWDRLRWLVDPAGRRWGYEYDPLGRRVAKVADDGSRVVFRWSGTQLVEQVDEATGAVLSWVYTPGGLVPVGQLAGSVGDTAAGGLLNLTDEDDPVNARPQDEIDRQFFAIVADQIGMPVGLLDPDSGALVGRATTTLWGQSSWSGESTPLRFPGQYADEESGLFYNLMRYYSPDTGRYLTPDPLGLAPAPNPYAYPMNPTVVADPLGLMPVDCDSFPGGSLQAHEDAGGHAIERHVGKSDEYLRSRFVGARPSMQAASTFFDLPTAEAAVKSLLRSHSTDIETWLDSGKPQLRLEGDVGDIVGRTLFRNSGNTINVSQIRVILRPGGIEDLGYYVATAFPAIPR
ncbi:putative T7SS-secreted protein [Williamsia sterculiae]|uniref:RHS repeat-associated core domain-containing protein n=1 Tax=Williamsia sterculiae TaxID=1344003 RepID=A0A1N7HBE4_9NOCA|nr:RNase A-like domain-containing protein [Williamsia sterculiae]SIS22020.1 RHS repeat-associated core domain-containing protein [Williamsia sterculiae]